MKCSGIDALTGRDVEVEFGAAIDTVRAAASGASGIWLAPGWIDLQVNGFAGVDYNDPLVSHDEIARSIRALFGSGVTRFYPTVITGPPEGMQAALRNLSCAREKTPEGAAIEGFHVEGPHISIEDGPRGAHPRQWVRKPDFGEFERWQDATRGRVRIVTLSPAWPEAPRYIERVVEAGAVASIGHTDATTAQIADAVSAGATLSTHLGNGSHSMLPRHPNYIFDQLAEDRLMAGFIVDGIHLDAGFLKVALRAKGISRSVLVTDAVSAANAVPGRYRLGELDVELTPAGLVELAGTGRLAGSALRMDRGVENLMRLAGLPLADAVRMATVNAARAGRVPGRSNGLVAGERADLVEFRFDEEGKRIEVTGTWVGGEKKATEPRP
jgi:N-acetylglucosamine-6-phosphate deacetylase